MELVKINLKPDQFSEREQVVAEAGSLSATSFLFPSGVCGLRVKNEMGELVILPFQGQQIWRAWFCGQELTMKSVFDIPQPTTDYLSTYGGFLLHCGATAMGVPSAADTHPLHGELPNLPYREATLTVGEDDGGLYMALGGKAAYAVAFSTYYQAEPEIKLHAGATVAQVSITLTNLRAKPMEYMYLCHINFHPVDGSELIYSAPADAAHVHAHRVIPEHLSPQAAAQLGQYIDAINQDPQVHHPVDPKKQVYDPEIVMTLHYLADPDGYAHTLQKLPDGAAYYVAHRLAELPLGLRWIARTVDEDALGIVLPATAEHKGLADARERGMMKSLAAGSRVTMSMTIGYLTAADTRKVEQQIQAILSANS